MFRIQSSKRIKRILRPRELAILPLTIFAAPTTELAVLFPIFIAEDSSPLLGQRSSIWYDCSPSLSTFASCSLSGLMIEFVMELVATFNFLDSQMNTSVKRIKSPTLPKTPVLRRPFVSAASHTWNLAHQGKYTYLALVSYASLTVM